MKQFHPLVIAEIRRETPDAVSIRFDVPEDLRETFAYVQGQHITLKREIEGQELRRCYSVCAAVADEELRIAVKRIVDGRFSGFANADLAVGDVVDVFPPMGNFFVPLDPGRARNYVAFAGGSGITPVISLIKTTLAVEPESRFALFYGNRDGSSVIFAEELARSKNRYMDRLEIFHFLEDDPQDVDFFNGLLDRKKCDRILASMADPAAVDEFFICGPGPMMDAAEAALLAREVAPRHIHIERFISGPAAASAAKRRKPDDKLADRIARVSVIVDGSRMSFDFGESDPSVLEAALAAGANVPFACKGGVCCTCRAKLVEGTVDMAKNYALEPDEVAAGYVLTCQSRPTSDTVVVDYDA